MVAPVIIKNVWMIMFSSPFKPALSLQLVHAFLCVLWNLIGIALIAQGMAALGPVASWTVVIAASVMGLLLLLGARRFVWLYLLVSALQLLLSINAVATPLIKDPSLWVYEGSRYAGMAVNLIGLLGSAWGIMLWLRLKSWRARVG